MKIEYTEGCTVGGLEIDKKDFYDYSPNEQKSIVEKIIEICDSNFLYDIICKYCIMYYINSEPYQYTCDDCGDDVYYYETNI